MFSFEAINCTYTKLRSQIVAQRWTSTCLVRLFSTSSAKCEGFKNVRAGKPKITVKGNRRLRYEEAQPPEMIGHRKTWNSWNTSSLHGESRAAQTTLEDYFIRSFIQGTFPTSVVSSVIIKRRHNLIYVAFNVYKTIPQQKMYFLIGYAEELLSCLLGCVLKLEIQTVVNRESVVFTKV